VRRLKLFIRLPWTERFLLGLWLLPLGSLRRFALRERKAAKRTHAIPQLVWAVRAVSRFVPLATCLTQALALQWLLARSGHASRVHLGTRKDLAGKFAAHAWVECEGRVVIGGAEAQDYSPLTVWEA